MRLMSYFLLHFLKNSGTIFLSKQRAVYIGHSTLKKTKFLNEKEK